MGQAQTTPTGRDALPIPTPPSVVDCRITPEHAKCKPVTVSQGFVDDATAAFKEIVAARDTIAQLLKERELTTAERKAWEATKAALDDIIAINGKIINAHIALEQTYQKIIAIQNDIIDQLQKQLTKKKSFFDKVLSVLKNATILLAGITLGRGL